jgi:hypothetical protein
LRSAGGDRGAFGGGGFVGRHSLMAIPVVAGLLTGVGCRFQRPLQLAGSMRGIIAESAKPVAGARSPIREGKTMPGERKSFALAPST